MHVELQRGPSNDDFGAQYSLEVCGALPTIDLLKTPLAALIGAQSHRHRRFFAFMRRYYLRAGTLYRGGALLAIAVILVPRPVGIAMTAPAGLYTLPSWVLMALTLGSDMMAITRRQFEFWYFTALNVVTWSLLATMYWDARVFSLVGGFLGMQSTILIDSNFRTVVNTLRSCMVAVPAIALIAVMAFFRRIDTDESNYRTIRVKAGVAVDVADVCANTAATLAIFVARKAYSKRKSLSKNSRGLRIIRCVVFRARLVMRSAASSQEATAVSGDEDPNSEPPSIAQAGAAERFRKPIFSRVMTRTALDAVQQVALVPSALYNIDARRTLVSFPLWHRVSPSNTAPPLPMPRSVWSTITSGITWGLVLHMNGVAGLVLTPIAMLQHSVTTALAVAALVATFAACVPVLLSCQRDVLRALLRNFDFLFLSVQFTVAMAMLCDMTQWTVRSLAVLAWFVWFQTVLLADAVTPPVRRTFGLSKRHTVLPLALSVVGLVSLSYALLFQNTALLVDRTLVTVSVGGGRSVSMGTKSVLLNRLLTLVVWGLRLLWEAAMCSKEELTSIRGSLEYYTPLEMFPPVSEVAITPLSILPAPAAEAARKFTHRLAKNGTRKSRRGSVSVESRK